MVTFDRGTPREWFHQTVQHKTKSQIMSEGILLVIHKQQSHTISYMQMCKLSGALSVSLSVIQAIILTHWSWLDQVTLTSVQHSCRHSHESLAWLDQFLHILQVHQLSKLRNPDWHVTMFDILFERLLWTYCPDMTFAVDWAVKKQLSVSIYLLT